MSKSVASVKLFSKLIEPTTEFIKISNPTNSLRHDAIPRSFLASNIGKMFAIQSREKKLKGDEKKANFTNVSNRINI